MDAGLGSVPLTCVAGAASPCRPNASPTSAKTDRLRRARFPRERVVFSSQLFRPETLLRSARTRPASTRQPAPNNVQKDKECPAAPPAPAAGPPAGTGVTVSEAPTPTFPPPHRRPTVYVPAGVDVGTT